MLWYFTSAVLQYRLHGTLPVSVPADPGRADALSVLRPPALPQVDFMEVIHQEQSCGRRRTTTQLVFNPHTQTCMCVCVCVRPGCAALYRSSCRKGSELTSSAALDRWKNSVATNSPDVLLSWKSRGVKLNLPGSGKKVRQKHRALIEGT